MKNLIKKINSIKVHRFQNLNKFLKLSESKLFGFDFKKKLKMNVAIDEVSKFEIEDKYSLENSALKNNTQSTTSNLSKSIGNKIEEIKYLPDKEYEQIFFFIKHRHLMNLKNSGIEENIGNLIDSVKLEYSLKKEIDLYKYIENNQINNKLESGNNLKESSEKEKKFNLEETNKNLINFLITNSYLFDNLKIRSEKLQNINVSKEESFNDLFSEGLQRMFPDQLCFTIMNLLRNYIGYANSIKLKDITSFKQKIESKLLESIIGLSVKQFHELFIFLIDNDEINLLNSVFKSAEENNDLKRYLPFYKNLFSFISNYVKDPCEYLNLKVHILSENTEDYLDKMHNFGESLRLRIDHLNETLKLNSVLMNNSNVFNEDNIKDSKFSKIPIISLLQLPKINDTLLKLEIKVLQNYLKLVKTMQLDVNKFYMYDFSIEEYESLSSINESIKILNEERINPNAHKNSLINEFIELNLNKYCFYTSMISSTLEGDNKDPFQATLNYEKIDFKFLRITSEELSILHYLNSQNYLLIKQNTKAFEAAYNFILGVNFKPNYMELINNTLEKTIGYSKLLNKSVISYYSQKEMFLLIDMLNKSSSFIKGIELFKNINKNYNRLSHENKNHIQLAIELFRKIDNVSKFLPNEYFNFIEMIKFNILGIKIYFSGENDGKRNTKVDAEVLVNYALEEISLNLDNFLKKYPNYTSESEILRLILNIFSIETTFFRIDLSKKNSLENYYKTLVELKAFMKNLSSNTLSKLKSNNIDIESIINFVNLQEESFNYANI